MAKEKVQEQPKDEIRFSSGSDLLDAAIGGNTNVFGYPAGKIINIVGDTQSGKTFLIWELLAAAVRKYGKRLKKRYDDAEHGNTFDTQKLYGITLTEDELVVSRTVQAFDCNYRLFVKNLKDNEIGIYCLDTLDGLTNKELQERAKNRLTAFENGKDFDKGSYMMETPKFLSQEFFKEITESTESKNVLLVIVSQIRVQTDEYAPKAYTRAGGHALDFYAHSVLWLQAKKKIDKGPEKNRRTVGVIDFAKLEKSKTPRPFRSCYFTLLFDYGLDNIGSNIDFLFDLITPKELEYKKTAVCKWDNQEEATADMLSELIKNSGKWELYKEEFGNSLKKSYLLDFIEGTTELKLIYDSLTGEGRNRDEMIAFIEENNLQDELTRRVREKWEKIEMDVKINRRPKYGS